MDSHPELQQIRTKLSEIHDALDNFNPLVPKPPIIDSSITKADEPGEENQWLQQGIGIPGLKKLKDDINVDLGALDKVSFLIKSSSISTMLKNPNFQ